MHRHVSKVSVIPIVADALVAISKDARTLQEKLGIPDTIARAQMSTLLGTVSRNNACDKCYVFYGYQLKLDISEPREH